MTTTTVRMYHVGFGDCFLVTIAGDDRDHRVLFDCGRHTGSRPPDEGEPTFRQVVERLVSDITDDDDVPRLDVIVVTHRHRDHVHGFSYGDLWERVEVGEVWLPWVEDLADPVAGRLRARQERSARRAFHALRSLRAASGSSSVDDAIEIAYNSTTNSTAFATIDGFGERGARLRYLPREGRLSDRLTGDDFGDHLPGGLTVHVLGPSRDPRVIKRLDPPAGAGYLALLPVGAEDTDVTSDVTSDRADPTSGVPTGSVPRPFPADLTLPTTEAEQMFGIDASERQAIRDAATGNPLEMVYRLDTAVNGTSLVLLFEIGDLRLLFPGDAQWGTWDELLQNPSAAELLDGLSFYKVGHHGSHNATPRSFVERFLATEVDTLAMVSVAPTKYGGGWQEIPKQELLEALVRANTQVVRSDGDLVPAGARLRREPGYYTEVTFSDDDE